MRIAEQFVEVLTAPGYEENALEALRAKPATRILLDRERRRFDPGERDYKRVLGGMLVQDRDWGIEDRQGMEVVCGTPSESVWGDLLFAWRVCKHVSSNAIVLAGDLRTLGIGAGQSSRVDAVRLAVEKAREHGHPLDGRVARVGRVLPVRGRAAGGARGRRHGADPARRLEARRRGGRGGARQRARRWSSPTGATSGTSRTGRRLRSPPALRERLRFPWATPSGSPGGPPRVLPRA